MSTPPNIPPPEPPTSAVLDRFATDIRHGGSGTGALGQPQRRSWRDLPLSWLVFPVMFWLARRGLLRATLAWSYALAPLAAAVLIGWEARRAGRRRALRGRTQPRA